ncbi:S9 family peptidase, partial [Salmonella enterica]|nr:S9 family peptidase [Salmonella enterica]
LVGNVIRDMIDAEITDGQNVYLFGHSAGGQFVHRLMSSQSHAPFKAVAAGNPGWYTLPTFDHPFPEGMDGVGLTEDHLV